MRFESARYPLARGMAERGKAKRKFFNSLRYGITVGDLFGCVVTADRRGKEKCRWEGVRDWWMLGFTESPKLRRRFFVKCGRAVNLGGKLKDMQMQELTTAYFVCHGDVDVS